MSIESIGVYSPDTIYGQLTMPFLNKPVTINAHTEFDEEEEEVTLTKNNFYNNKSKMQVSIEDIRDMKGFELDDKISTKIAPEFETDILTKNALPSFQLSSFSTGTGIVYEALQNGYTGSNAIIISKAHNAYQNAAKHNLTDAVQTLVSTGFKVA